MSTVFNNQDGKIYWLDSGTSFAAPLVAGLAAMIKNYDPSLTNLEIKAAILDN
jgi:subtilisin family serine protease